VPLLCSLHRMRTNKRDCSKHYHRTAPSTAELFVPPTESRSTCSRKEAKLEIGSPVWTTFATGSSVALSEARDRSGQREVLCLAPSAGLANLSMYLLTAIFRAVLPELMDRTVPKIGRSGHGRSYRPSVQK
jgi:hypothetical protein